MTEAEFELHVKERGAETFMLSLTSDELDWLLLEVFPAAIRNAESSLASEMKSTKDDWWSQANEQGYTPF